MNGNNIKKSVYIIQLILFKYLLNKKNTDRIFDIIVSKKNFPIIRSLSTLILTYILIIT